MKLLERAEEIKKTLVTKMGMLQVFADCLGVTISEECTFSIMSDEITPEVLNALEDTGISSCDNFQSPGFMLVDTNINYTYPTWKRRVLVSVQVDFGEKSFSLTPYVGKRKDDSVAFARKIIQHCMFSENQRAWAILSQINFGAHCQKLYYDDLIPEVRTLSCVFKNDLYPDLSDLLQELASVDPYFSGPLNPNQELIFVQKENTRQVLEIWKEQFQAFASRIGAK